MKDGYLVLSLCSPEGLCPPVSRRLREICHREVSSSVVSYLTWLEQWRVKVNNTKSTQITFTTSRIVCPQTTIYNAPVPMKSEVTYRGLHLDQRFACQAHIKAKGQHLICVYITNYLHFFTMFLSF